MKKAVPVNMMGVVIYISKDRQRAILWCEDHGPLAYVRREKALLDQELAIAIGDCVNFVARTDGDFRIGRKLELARLPPVSSLPALLGTKDAAGPGRVSMGNVVYPEFTKQRRCG